MTVNDHKDSKDTAANLGSRLPDRVYAVSGKQEAEKALKLALHIGILNDISLAEKFCRTRLNFGLSLDQRASKAHFHEIGTDTGNAIYVLLTLGSG